MTDAPGSTCDIAIGICTFRRPHLTTTLQSLGAVGGARVAVFVADNDDTPPTDPASTTLSLIEAAACPVPLICLHAPARNISIARNAVLVAAKAAGARYLAFLDDDETVGAGWLDHLLGVMAETGAAAVLGPVEARYQPGAPAWMQTGAVHDTHPVTDNTGTILSGYTCNVLIDLHHLSTQRLMFDLARGRTGGEDTAFFHAMRKAGGSIAYAPQALAREDVPADRATLRWLLRRRYRMGQTHGSLIVARQNRAARVGTAAIAGAKVLACLGLAIRHVANDLARNRALMRAALHVGTVSAAFGRAGIELYGTPDATKPDFTTDRTLKETRT